MLRVSLTVLFFILSVQNAFALCINPSYLLVGECDKHKCHRGFKVDVEIGSRAKGCKATRTLTQATENDLFELSANIDWMVKYKDNQGVFQYQNELFRGDTKQLDFNTLEEAKQFWHNRIMHEYMIDMLWNILDICVSLYCAVILYRSIKNFNKGHILKETNVRSAFVPQIKIFLVSIVPFAFFGPFYIVYWTAIFFVIIPVVWIAEVACIVVHERLSARRKFGVLDTCESNDA